MRWGIVLPPAKEKIGFGPQTGPASKTPEDCSSAVAWPKRQFLEKKTTLLGFGKEGFYVGRAEIWAWLIQIFLSAWTQEKFTRTSKKNDIQTRESKPGCINEKKRRQ